MLSVSLSDLTKLNNKLKEIRGYPPREDRYGICRLVDKEHRHICMSIWINWEHYSGVEVFPVPHSTMKPHVAFYRNNRWSKKSKYGQMRFKLLDYLIEQTELKIKELS